LQILSDLQLETLVYFVQNYKTYSIECVENDASTRSPNLTSASLTFDLLTPIPDWFIPLPVNPRANLQQNWLSVF